jgi:hypothetical protein
VVVDLVVIVVSRRESARGTGMRGVLMNYVSFLSYVLSIGLISR